MKGVQIIFNETTKKRYVQIDMALIVKNREAVEDYLDVLLIRSREREPSIAVEDFERRFKKAARK